MAVPALETIALSMADGIARITLDRPDDANCLSLQMTRDLVEAVAACEFAPDLRVVLLDARGTMFCGGGDLKQTPEDPRLVLRHVEQVTSNLHMAVSRLTRLPLPVVAAVQGVAAGGGMSLALAADIVIAGRSARFTSAYSRIGLCPEGSMSYFLPRLVGLRRAVQIAFDSPIVGADDALAMGLITRVVADDALAAEAEAQAQRYARGPTRSYAMAKRLLHAGLSESLETQLESETRAIAALLQTDDWREGLAAFKQKRKPSFGGR
jgi:2-(1,2-epoxy-1,2-dihydrophenyl)acetyl-CoA isomerase